MKKRSAASEVYLILMTVLMYLPILIVMAYSFNESKLSSVWSGFSLTWYADLFRDRDIGTALINSLILGVLSSLAAAVIGTLGAIGTQRTSFRGKGVMEYIATLPMMTPEIILGMLFLAFFSLLGLPFGMMTLVISHTAFCIPYVFMQVKADQDEDRIRNDLRNNRQNVRSQFNVAANELEDYARQFIKSNVNRPLETSISVIDGNIQEIRDTRADRSSSCRTLENLQRECRYLIQDIHAERS